MPHFINCIIAIYLFTIQVIHSLNNGDLCVDTRVKITGFCKTISKCPQAIEDLQKGIAPITCGFLGKDPIICCIYEQNSTSPGEVITTTTTTYPMIFGASTPSTTTSRSKGESESTEETSEAPEAKISSTKCKEYGKLVFANWTSPILLIGHYAKVDTCGIRLLTTTNKNFARPREFPHSALIGYKYLNNKHWRCGGTLLSERHVLTSAQCTYSDMYGYARYVRVGISDFADKNDDSDLQDLDVLEIVKHPRYNEATLKNNIALLKLATPAELSPHVRPACLPSSKNLEFKQVLISGWGTVNYTENNDFVLKLQLSSVQKCCSPGIRGEICTNRQFCVETTDDYICVADRGGPAEIYHPDVYCSYTVVGVASSWNSCPNPGRPPVFTRVSKYIDWIESNVWL